MNSLKRFGLFAVATGAAATVTMLTLSPPGVPHTVETAAAPAAATRPATQVATPPSVERSAATARPVTAPMPGQHPLTGRHQLSYTLALGAAGGPPGTMAQVALSAEVVLALTEKSDGQWLVGRLTSGELRGGQAASQRGTGAPNVQPFAGTVAVRLSPGGAFAELRYDASIPEPVQATLKSVLHAAQLVESESAGSTKWSALEDGVNTAYRATYERHENAIDKTWETVDGADATYAESGSARFTFDQGTLEGIESTQKGRIDLQDGQSPALAFDAKTTWKRVGDAEPSLASALDPNTMRALDVERYAADTSRTVSPVMTEAALDALVAKAGEAGQAGRWQERHALGSQLADALKAAGPQGEPALVARVAALVRSADDEPTRRTLLEGLGAAETAKAQAALLALSADRGLDAATRTQAFGATTFVQKPTPELVRGLEEAAYSSDPDALPAQAVVTLGAVLRSDLDQRGDVTSEVARRFADEARIRLRPAHDGSAIVPETGETPPSEEPAPTVVPPAAGQLRREWTRAIGNAALPELAPVLLGLLNDPDEYVRVAAAFSTRFYDPGPLLAALPDVMANDDSILVRAAVLQACQFLGPGVCETLVRKAIRHDISVRVRESAAYTVATWMQDTPALSAILSEAIAEEKSPEVAETLQNYLVPGRVAHPFRVVAGDAAEVAP